MVDERKSALVGAHFSFFVLEGSQVGELVMGDLESTGTGDWGAKVGDDGLCRMGLLLLDDVSQDDGSSFSPKKLSAMCSRTEATMDSCAEPSMSNKSCNRSRVV